MTVRQAGSTIVACLMDRVCMDDTPWLLLAAAGTALAVLLHIGCIIFGARWYAFFGAGERMVRLSRAGHPFPTAITTAITAVLALWTAYALSAAGWLPVLPGRQEVLVLIIAVLGVRGLAGLLIGRVRPGCNGARFWYTSSAACLTLAGLHLAGSVQVWTRL
ncbi:hypothetical protein G9274_000670 [Stenotrophomonas rhizophila]|nr:hypothetical protein [Stenotrophomonas sp.]QIO86985.1 hypothetical protein G9274_000670 [Stenotrophomonas rhizophila]